LAFHDDSGRERAPQDEIVSALERLAQADFSVRLPRQPQDPRNDTLAVLINGIAEHLDDLWNSAKRQRDEQAKTVDMVSEGLLAMVSGRFDWSAKRTGDGSLHDVLAFLLNNTVQELSHLVCAREQQASEVATLRSAQTTERLAGMGVLAAGAAHELSSPLTASMLLLKEARDALRSGRSSRNVLPLIDTALEGVEKASELLEDLRMFAREKPRAPTSVRLDLVVQSAVRLLRHEAKSRCEVEVDVEPLVVTASEARLGQVFVNLIKNAIQAIPPGDRLHQRVRVTARGVAGRACIRIRDTGRGMSDAVLARLFEPFFTTKGAREGTGLGLVISQATVCELGGTLQITSAEGVGTVVLIELPVAAAVQATPSFLDDGLGDGQTNSPWARPSVLVVDDDPMLLGALCHVLRKEYEVHSAASGPAALELLEREGDVDLIICDVMMPRMTGIELREKVAAFRPGLADRFLFFSGGGVTLQARDFLDQLGDYLRKPVTRQQLLRAVERRLAASREALTC